MQDHREVGATIVSLPLEGAAKPDNLATVIARELAKQAEQERQFKEKAKLMANIAIAEQARNDFLANISRRYINAIRNAGKIAIPGGAIELNEIAKIRKLRIVIHTPHVQSATGKNIFKIAQEVGNKSAPALHLALIDNYYHIYKENQLGKIDIVKIQKDENNLFNACIHGERLLKIKANVKTAMTSLVEVKALRKQVADFLEQKLETVQTKINTTKFGVEAIRPHKKRDEIWWRFATIFAAETTGQFDEAVAAMPESAFVNEAIELKHNLLMAKREVLLDDSADVADIFPQDIEPEERLASVAPVQFVAEPNVEVAAPNLVAALEPIAKVSLSLERVFAHGHYTYKISGTKQTGATTEKFEHYCIADANVCKIPGFTSNHKLRVDLDGTLHIEGDWPKNCSYDISTTHDCHVYSLVSRHHIKIKAANIHNHGTIAGMQGVTLLATEYLHNNATDLKQPKPIIKTDGVLALEMRYIKSKQGILQGKTQLQIKADSLEVGHELQAKNLNIEVEHELHLKGVTAEQNMHLQFKGEQAYEYGKLTAGNDITILQPNSALTLVDPITAVRKISLESTKITNSTSVASHTSDIEITTTSNDLYPVHNTTTGSLQAGGQIEMHANGLLQAGVFKANRDITLDVSNLNLQQKIASGADLVCSLNGEFVQAAGATIEAGRICTITNTQTVQTHAAIKANEKININLTGETAILATNADLTSHGEAGIDINCGKFSNRAICDATVGAIKVTTTSEEPYTVTNTGSLKSAKTMDIAGQGMLQQGAMHAVGDTTLNVANLELQQKMSSAGNINCHLNGEFVQAAGATVTAGKTLEINNSQTVKTNAAMQATAGIKLTLTGQDSILETNNELRADGEAGIVITAARFINNSTWQSTAGGMKIKTRVDAGAQPSVSRGEIKCSGNFNIDTSALNLAAGLFKVDGDFVINRELLEAVLNLQLLAQCEVLGIIWAHNIVGENFAYAENSIKANGVIDLQFIHGVSLLHPISTPGGMCLDVIQPTTGIEFAAAVRAGGEIKAQAAVIKQNPGCTLDAARLAFTGEVLTLNSSMQAADTVLLTATRFIEYDLTKISAGQEIHLQLPLARLMQFPAVIASSVRYQVSSAVLEDVIITHDVAVTEGKYLTIQAPQANMQIGTMNAPSRVGAKGKLDWQLNLLDVINGGVFGGELLQINATAGIKAGRIDCKTYAATAAYLISQQKLQLFTAGNIEAEAADIASFGAAEFAARVFTYTAGNLYVQNDADFSEVGLFKPMLLYSTQPGAKLSYRRFGKVLEGEQVAHYFTNAFQGSASGGSIRAVQSCISIHPLLSAPNQGNLHGCRKYLSSSVKVHTNPAIVYIGGICTMAADTQLYGSCIYAKNYKGRKPSVIKPIEQYDLYQFHGRGGHKKDSQCWWFEIRKEITNKKTFLAAATSSGDIKFDIKCLAFSWEGNVTTSADRSVVVANFSHGVIGTSTPSYLLGPNEFTQVNYLADSLAPSPLYRVTTAAESADTVMQAHVPIEYGTELPPEVIIDANILTTNSQHLRRLLTPFQEMSLITRIFFQQLGEITEHDLHYKLRAWANEVRQNFEQTRSLVNTNSLTMLNQLNITKPLLLYQRVNFIGTDKSTEEVLTPILWFPAAYANKKTRYGIGMVAGKVVQIIGDLEASTLQVGGDIQAVEEMALILKDALSITGRANLTGRSATLGVLSGDMEIRAQVSQGLSGEDVLERPLIAMDDSITAAAGRNVHLQAAQLQAGAAGIRIAAGGDILDAAIPVTTITAGNSGDTEIVEISTTQVVTEYTTTGTVTEEAEAVTLYAPRVTAAAMHVESRSGTTAVLDVHDYHQRDERTTRKSGKVIRKKTVAQASTVAVTSRGAQFNVTEEVKLSGATGVVVRNLQSSARVNKLLAPQGRVAIEQGVDQRSGSYSTTSDSAFWRRAVVGDRASTTYRPAKFTGRVEITASKLEIQTVRGKTLALMQQIINKSQITHYSQLQEQHAAEERRSSGPGIGLATLVTLAAGVACTGIAAKLATRLALGSKFATVAISAGFGALSGQAANALLQHRGDLGKVMRSLTESRNVKSLATTMLSAGILDKICGALKLPRKFAEKSLKQHLQQNLARASVNTALNVVINKQDCNEALKAGLLDAAVTTAAGIAAQEIGMLYSESHPQRISSLQHKVMHAAVGAAAGAITGGGRGAAAGALGAVVAEVVAESVTPDVDTVAKAGAKNARATAATAGATLTAEDIANAEHASVTDATEHAADIGKLAAATVALLAKQNVAISIATATTALENNFAPSVLRQWGEKFKVLECLAADEVEETAEAGAAASGVELPSAKQQREDREFAARLEALELLLGDRRPGLLVSEQYDTPLLHEPRTSDELSMFETFKQCGNSLMHDPTFQLLAGATVTTVPIPKRWVPKIPPNKLFPNGIKLTTDANGFGLNVSSFTSLYHLTGSGLRDYVLPERFKPLIHNPVYKKILGTPNVLGGIGRVSQRYLPYATAAYAAGYIGACVCEKHTSIETASVIDEQFKEIEDFFKFNKP